MSTPLYSVGTWDTDAQAYTPQVGLSVPSFNITKAQLRVAVRELKAMGYSCHRIRHPDGEHYDNDWCVLIERTDAKFWEDIKKDWER